MDGRGDLPGLSGQAAPGAVGGNRSILILEAERRLLRFLVAGAGIRQFLDIGTGLPLVGNTHEIAHVGNDPMVLSPARALMRSAPGGAVGYVDADVRDPVGIVAGAAATLDASRPVAVLLLFTLAYVEADAEAAWVVATLLAALPAGSYVALYHLASDLDPDLAEAARQWNKH